MAFDFYNVAKNSNDNLVYIEKQNGFDSGSYRIEIYSPKNKLRPIGVSGFEIR